MKKLKISFNPFYFSEDDYFLTNLHINIIIWKENMRKLLDTFIDESCDIFSQIFYEFTVIITAFLLLFSYTKPLTEHAFRPL